MVLRSRPQSEATFTTRTLCLKGWAELSGLAEWISACVEWSAKVEFTSPTYARDSERMLHSRYSHKSPWTTAASTFQKRDHATEPMAASTICRGLRIRLRMPSAKHGKAMRDTAPDTGGDPKRFTAVQLAWEQVGAPEARAAYEKGRGTETKYSTNRRTSSKRFERPAARPYGRPGGSRRERYLESCANGGSGCHDRRPVRPRARAECAARDSPHASGCTRGGIDRQELSQRSGSATPCGTTCRRGLQNSKSIT